MKNLFKGFYNVENQKLEQLWNDKNTLFVFDANVLLNLYGYAKQTREDFFNILDALSDNIWIPYHAGLEYQRRRLTVIKNEKGVFKEIETNLDKIQKVFDNFKPMALKRRFPKLSDSTDELQNEINKNIEKYKETLAEWDKEQPCVRTHDSIRAKINQLFDGKVGEKPESQEWLNNLFNEGKERFENNIPPGFKDAKKGNNEQDSFFNYDELRYERKFGDLIIWKQLIDKSKEPSIKNVVFITDDNKEDWWYKIESNGKKIVGPLAELQAEIYSKSEIDAFHMYNTSMFMEDGQSFLKVKVEESSIIDASTPHFKPKNEELIEKLIKLRNSEKCDHEDLLCDSEGEKDTYLDLYTNSFRGSEFFKNRNYELDCISESERFDIETYLKMLSPEVRNNVQKLIDEKIVRDYYDRVYDLDKHYTPSDILNILWKHSASKKNDDD